MKEDNHELINNENCVAFEDVTIRRNEKDKQATIRLLT